MFQRARRHAHQVRAGIFGMAGSGKTWSALALAQGLGGRVALVDAEGGAAAMLADRFAFDMHVLEPPFCPSRFVTALQEAERQGYETVVLDGLSAAWIGSGGVLEQVDEARQAGERNPWQWPGERHEALLRAVAEAGCHVLATMRARSRWEMVEGRGRDGSVQRRRVLSGLQPEQRSDIAYAFHVFWRLEQRSHQAMALKDMSGQFEGRSQPLSQEAGRELLLWAQGGGQHSGLERALTAIRACGSVEELAVLWGDWPEAWKRLPWQDVCSKAVAQRLRELQGGQAA